MKCLNLIIPMSIVKTFGVLLISLCPAFITIMLYINMIKRINQLEYAKETVSHIKRLLQIKVLKMPEINKNLTMLTDEEVSLFYNFLTDCSQNSSDILIGSCENLLSFFDQRLTMARSDFNKHGKITVSSGICLGIVIFILAI